MSLDLKKLERKLDKALERSTPESLREFLRKKRLSEKLAGTRNNFKKWWQFWK